MLIYGVLVPETECNHSLEWLEKIHENAHIRLEVPSMRAFLNAISRDGGDQPPFLTHSFVSNVRCWHEADKFSELKVHCEREAEVVHYIQV